MRGRLLTRIEDRQRWDRLSVSFWFIPLVMATVSVLLAWAIYWVDGRIPNEVLESSRFIVAGTVDEVRGFLFTMATTCLATAGVVFTLLTLPLSTVAAQYGSRLLRIFLGDRVTQFVLGVFVATFVYCISSALVIPPVEIQPEPPQLLVTIGFFLFLGTFASLILLIQHIATMLQAPNIAAVAGSELMDVVGTDIQEVFGAGTRQQVGGESSDPPIQTAGYPVRAPGPGYIQYIDPRRILALARERDLVIRLLLKPGRFAVSGAVLATVWPAERVDAQSEREIRNAFHLGKQRTPTQDVEYAVNQLAEMAVRAMSPAINDPFTAMTCLDYMGDGLAQFVRQRNDSPTIYDREGRLRIVLDPVTFDQLLDAAFDMLRHASCNNAKVLLHMVDVADAIGRETDSPEARRTLARHVALIEAESRAGNLVDEDRGVIGEKSEVLMAELGGSSH
jgi:uncharacterized membrane protein